MTSPPIPSGPPISCSPPSWLSYANGKGPTYSGNAYRVMNTFRKTLADQICGPVPGVRVQELAKRTSQMNSSQLVAILQKIQSQAKDVHFSHYLATRPIQSIDAVFLKKHIQDLMVVVPNAKDAIWIFPLHIKTKFWFAEADHMTVLLVINGHLEYYDPVGKGMKEQLWDSENTLEAVARLVHETLGLDPPFQLTENYKLHQSDTVLCGFLVSAWLHHRINRCEGPAEWKNWLKETDDNAIRSQVAKMLPEPPPEPPAEIVAREKPLCADDFECDIA